MPLRTFLPYDILGAGLWAVAVLPARLLLLAVARQGRGLHRQGRRRVQRARRRRARDLVRRPLPPRRRSSAPRSRQRLDAQPGVAARPRPADVRRRPRDARPRARHAAVARRRRHLPVLRPRVADRARSTLRLDQDAFDVADALYMPALGSVIRVATNLGSLAGHRRRRARHRDLGRPRHRRTLEGVALVLAHALTYVAVHVAKDATDRPRPVRTSTPTPRGSPIPPATPPTRSPTSPARSSSPAAATTGRPASALVTIAVALAAAVAASRVYLRAHYLSDVIGGLALATAIYALVGARRARHRDRA